MKWYMPAQTNPPPVLCPALTPLLGEPWEFPDDNRNLNHTYSMLGLYLSGAWKPVSEPARRYWQISYCVPLPPSSLSLIPRLLFSSVNKPQNFTSPALNGAHQAIFWAISHKRMKKVSLPPFPSPPSTPPCSAMKWHPYLINCESWNFAQETPFLYTWQWLNCTAMQFHSPRRWEEGSAGEELRLYAEWEMKASSPWHHRPLLNGTATEGPFLWVGSTRSDSTVVSYIWSIGVWRRRVLVCVCVCASRMKSPSQTFNWGPKNTGS